MFQNNGNCTAYAWGRLYEITGHRYTGLYGNAEKWYDQAQIAGLEVGQEPKLGAIACWMQGDTSTAADGAGHVAVVEEVHDDGSWTASMSGYQHYLFKTVEIGPDNSYGGMEFRGFIYCGLEFDGKEAMSMDDARKLVVCDYAQYLGRMPSPGDIDADSWQIVDTGMTTEQYDYSFLVSDEYKARYGILAAQDFVTRCYRAFLGRFPESEDALMHQCQPIIDGTARYRDIAWNIYTSDEAKAYRGEA
ncbi:MAG: CHAP domain-containing protein [Lachnospira sp.]|nr:CHAP domain-containing protein [Lachnospira sp.]